MADFSPTTLARFWSNVRVTANKSDCWEWQFTLNSQGYGRFFMDAKRYPAHRIAYTIFNGPIPEGMIVRHRCHNRICCNPAHLVVGTSKDNAQDALKAGRFSAGTVNGNSKLTDEAVRYIIQNPDKLKGVEIARRLGVSKATVSGVRNGRVWRHVAA
jgi:hypothetical protein